MMRGVTGLGAIVAIALVSSLSTAARAAVVFTETFDDLNDWTIVDADGAGTANVVEAVGGKLHVSNSSSNWETGAGIYQQAAPLTGRIYFWGFTAATNGPQGFLNLSPTSGLHTFATPMGVYLPERGGSLPTQIRPQLNANGDTGSADGAIVSGVSYDFFLEYNANPNVGLFYKESSQTGVSDWIQIGVHQAYTASANPYFINLVGSGPALSGFGQIADWTLDQIDITDRDDDLLIAPVPEPGAGLTLLALAGLGALRRRRTC